MAFSRRKDASKESSKRSRLGRGASRDPFEHLSEERASVEEEEPWFLAPDIDAADLKVEAGISSNLQAEDLTAPQPVPDEAEAEDDPALPDEQPPDPSASVVPEPPVPDEEPEEAQPNEPPPVEPPWPGAFGSEPAPPDPPPISTSLDAVPLPTDEPVPLPEEPPPGAITDVPMPDSVPSEPDEPVLPDEPYRPPTAEAAESFFESADFEDDEEPGPVDEEQRRALTSVFSNVLANQATTSANGEPQAPEPDGSTDAALGFAGIDPSLSPGYYDPEEHDRSSESFDLDGLSEPRDLDEPSRPRTRVEPRRPRPRVTRPRRF